MTDQQFYLLLHFLLGVVGLQLLVSVHAWSKFTFFTNRFWHLPFTPNRVN
jgi:hypothetical protein